MEILLDEANFREESQAIGENSYRQYFYNYDRHVIWGATARIVKGLLDIVRAGLVNN